jgi:hypothetical protein
VSRDILSYSGTPLVDVTPLTSKSQGAGGGAQERNMGSLEVKKPSNIRFLRHRMLYARPNMKAKGIVLDCNLFVRQHLRLIVSS